MTPRSVSPLSPLPGSHVVHVTAGSFRHVSSPNWNWDFIMSACAHFLISFFQNDANLHPVSSAPPSQMAPSPSPSNSNRLLFSFFIPLADTHFLSPSLCHWLNPNPWNFSLSWQHFPVTLGRYIPRPAVDSWNRSAKPSPYFDFPHTNVDSYGKVQFINPAQ